MRKGISFTAVLTVGFLGLIPLFHTGCAGPGKTSKEVLAFYYSWYGTPEGSQRWVHWKDVDTINKRIANSTNYPAIGPYDSHDPKLLERHCRQAKEAGVTGFIMTWWRQKDFHDQAMPLMLDQAREHGLKITVYYETVPPRGAPEIDGAVNDLEYILDAYGSHPAWLKANGQPVIFVYGRAVNEIKLEGWKEVIARLRGKNRQVALIGDRISPESAAIFDGIHTYNPTGRTKGMSAEEVRTWARNTFPEWVKIGGERISCVTIIPGYDDNKLGRPGDRPITQRFGGATYRAMWEEAIAANPDWVLITSWNEWHEGSEIEPSVEDGDLALKITAEYAPRFLKQPARTRKAAD